MMKWDIYEIRPDKNPIVGVMFRGRVRKFCLERKRNVLVENAQDVDGVVRFAVLSGEEVGSIKDYVQSIVPGCSIDLVMKDVFNPVLSKLKVNNEERYTLN